MKSKGGAETLYDSILLERARQKKWVGAMKRPDLHSQAANPRCGDEIEMFVRLKKSRVKGRPVIEELSYEASACVLCLASANAMGEKVRDLGESETKSIHKTLKKYLEGEDLKHLSLKKKSKSDLVEIFKIFSGVREYPSRIFCVLLPWQALELAWKKNKKRGSLEKRAAP